jgi:hypothetical protein
MKIGTFILLLAVFIVACERYPANPPKVEEPVKTAYIHHVGTDYVPADTTVHGIMADKVNILLFEIKVDNFIAKSLEFYGKAVLEGPPEYHEHAIHFHTDDIVMDPGDVGYTLNTLDFIQSGPWYPLVRAKFPTNEYSPFEGTQGKVIEVSINEVWAYDEFGQKYSVTLGDIP